MPHWNWGQRMRSMLAAMVVLFALSLHHAGAAMLLNTPVYNPETKSYFELYAPDPEKAQKHENIYGLSWRAAWRLAQKLRFHGVQGRLAVVKSRAVSDFLRDTFKPEMEVWIGLRYWCRFHKFQWVTGDFWKPGDFALWGRIWDQEAMYPSQPGTGEAREHCYYAYSTLGVHYWRPSLGWFWNANGYDKHWNLMFVEYPTGKP